MTRFKYYRHNLCIRVSNELDREIEQAAEALRATKTDVVIYALLLMFDPTGRGCPDVQHLPDELKADFDESPRSRLAAHFSKPEGFKDTTDWEKVLGRGFYKGQT